MGKSLSTRNAEHSSQTGLFDALMNDHQSDSQSLAATVGIPFSVNLWEDRTRGEQWVPSYDPSQLVLTDDEFLRTTSNNAVDSGKRRFEFEPIRAGIHRLEFHKRMAWKFTSEARRVFLVHVQESVS